LVDGDEVIHDSKRILQYLEWRYRGPGPIQSEAEDD
jgi:glutathione S-transferase